MGWIIAIIVGGVAGWLASIVMRRDASMGIFWNIIVGIIGALLGNAVLAPLLGFGGSIQTFDLGALRDRRPRRDRAAGDRQSGPARPRSLSRADGRAAGAIDTKKYRGAGRAAARPFRIASRAALRRALGRARGV